MAVIEAVGYFRFNADQRDAVLRIVRECIRLVSEMDVGTLSYEWLISDSGTEVLVREKYQDSAALLTHAANVAEQLAALRELAEARMEVYGEPSPELLTILRHMQVPVFRRLTDA